MAVPRLKQRENVVCGSFSEPVSTQRSWRQVCSTPGPTLITAGKLQNCNGVDERGKKTTKREVERKKIALICYGQWCHMFQSAHARVVALSAISSNSF